MLSGKSKGFGVRLLSAPLLALMLAACGGGGGGSSDDGGSVTDGVAPQVTARTPRTGTTGVVLTAPITATFDEALLESSVTAQTVRVEDANGNPAAGAVALSNDGLTISFTPTGLDYAMDHTVTLKGGANGVKDASGEPLAADVTWTFNSGAKVAAGGYTSCVRLDDGGVKCWGENGSGQLGQGDFNDRGNAADEMGDNLTAIALGTGRKAVHLSVGENHACALLDDGSVKCWGSNSLGQLGQGDINSRGDETSEMGDHLLAIDLGAGRSAVAIAAGYDHTCALLDDGSVKCWGGNLNGQLGLGDTNNRGDEANEMGVSLPAADLGTGRTAVAITAGFAHSCALLDDGSVKCWGRNTYGQLGQGDNVSRGDDPDEMGDNLPAIVLGTGRSAVAIGAGSEFSCALLDNGAVKCWGDNQAGQLGQGDSNERGDAVDEMGDSLLAIDLGTGLTAVRLMVGPLHVCAVLDDAATKCWGNNDIDGQLGRADDTTEVRGDEAGEMGDDLPALDLGTGRTVVDLDIGTYHSCALLDDGAVKCWGYNIAGQLGLGDTSSRGYATGSMGDDLPAVDYYGTGSP